MIFLLLTFSDQSVAFLREYECCSGIIHDRLSIPLVDLEGQGPGSRQCMEESLHRDIAGEESSRLDDNQNNVLVGMK